MARARRIRSRERIRSGQTVTRYIGVRFEYRYRDPDYAPFRFDHPTVGVGRQRLWQITDVADALDVRTAAFLEVLGTEDRPYVHSHTRHDPPQSFRVPQSDAETLARFCRTLRQRVESHHDVEAIAADIDAAETTNVRDSVGERRYDALKAYERTGDLLELCHTCFELDVSLEVVSA